MVLACPVDWMDWKYHSSDHCDSVGSLWNNGYVLLIICLKVLKRGASTRMQGCINFHQFPKELGEPPPPPNTKRFPYSMSITLQKALNVGLETRNRTFAVAAPRLWKLPPHCRLDVVVV